MASPLPSPRHQVLSFPTPKTRDIIFYELKDGRAPAYLAQAQEYGTPHPNTAHYPNHKLVYVVEDGKQVGWFRWYYAANREDQDDYNWEIVRDTFGDKNESELVRTYVLPREDVPDNMQQPALGTADTRFVDYTYRGYRVQQLDETLNGLYVAVQFRYWEPRNCPMTDLKMDIQDGSKQTITKVREPAGSLHPELPEPLPYYDESTNTVYEIEAIDCDWQWFIIRELEENEDAVLRSRIYDNSIKGFINRTVTVVVPDGTPEGTADIPTETITEEEQRELTKSTLTVEDHDLPTPVVTNHILNNAVGTIVLQQENTVQRGSVAGSISPGVVTEVNNLSLVDDKVTTTIIDLPSPWITDYQFDDSIDQMVRIRKRAVAPNTIVGSVGDGYRIEVQGYNEAMDFVIESSLAQIPLVSDVLDPSWTVADYVAPAAKQSTCVVKERIPAILHGVRVTGAWAWAKAVGVSNEAFDFSHDWFADIDVEDAQTREVLATIVRTIEFTPVTATPNPTWEERSDSFGVSSTQQYAVASDTDTSARAQASCIQVNLPNAAHRGISIAVGASPFFTSAEDVGGIDVWPERVLLPPTAGFGNWNNQRYFDSDSVPRRFGLYENIVKVRGTVAGGGEGSVPASPIILDSYTYPADGDTWVPLDPTFAFTSPTSAAVTPMYLIEILPSGLESPAITDEFTNTGAGAQSCNFAGTPLTANTTYSWQVRAQNSGGRYGLAGPVYGFTTVPAAPVLSFPTDNYILVGDDFVFNWNDVTGATSYDFQVDNNSDFSSPQMNTSPASSTEVPVGLSYGTLYCRVRGEKSAVNTNWSTVIDFVYVDPAAPTNLLPDSGTAPITGPVIPATWDTTGAQVYQFQVFADAGGAPDPDVAPTLIDDTIATGFVDYDGLVLGSGTFWHRVRSMGTDLATQGAWSTLEMIDSYTYAP